MNEKLIKAKELANIFPLWTEKTYLRKAKDGELPCTKIGKRYFFDPKEIDSYIRSITIKTGGNYARANH